MDRWDEIWRLVSPLLFGYLGIPAARRRRRGRPLCADCVETYEKNFGFRDEMSLLRRGNLANTRAVRAKQGEKWAAQLRESYTLTPADTGAFIGCTVTATTAAGGAAAVDAAPVGPVTAAAPLRR
jgi:hypothetical protein